MGFTAHQMLQKRRLVNSEILQQKLFKMRHRRQDWKKEQGISELQNNLSAIYFKYMVFIVCQSYFNIAMKNKKYGQYPQEFIIQSLNQGRFINNMTHSSINWYHQFNLATWGNKYIYTEQFLLIKLKNIFPYREHFQCLIVF